MGARSSIGKVVANRTFHLAIITAVVLLGRMRVAFLAPRLKRQVYRIMRANRRPAGIMAQRCVSECLRTTAISGPDTTPRFCFIGERNAREDEGIDVGRAFVHKPIPCAVTIRHGDVDTRLPRLTAARKIRPSRFAFQHEADLTRHLIAFATKFVEEALEGMTCFDVDFGLH